LHQVAYSVTEGAAPQALSATPLEVGEIELTEEEDVVVMAVGAMEVTEAEDVVVVADVC